MATKLTIARVLEEGLALEGRRVLSPWRAGVLLRRATQRIPPEHRRWERVPSSEGEIERILRRLAGQGELRPLEGVVGLYVVASPFAQQGPIAEDEILMELHPYATLSHLSALVFHGLTDLLPHEFHATIGTNQDELPVGTDAGDWDGVSLTRARPVREIRGVPIRWHRLSRGSGVTGASLYQPRGYPVRVTDPEMSLLDGLLHPEWCGGFENVLQAWQRASDTLDVDRIVDHVELCDMAILRQRAGWVLEQLGVTDARLDEWATRAVRGGSSRLVGSAPFAPRFSERWKLSLNAPTAALES
ncbi:hypothetical protein [Vulgatibacter sp.]|uniref:type IV toxin-antitoxin system AbiEi family antitoxin domain-containing protein n=1 Tax=Vulgatibacter sp. TaxID=1971226 RepID=UPI003563686C